MSCHNLFAPNCWHWFGGWIPGKTRGEIRNSARRAKIIASQLLTQILSHPTYHEINIYNFRWCSYKELTHGLWETSNFECFVRQKQVIWSMIVCWLRPCWFLICQQIWAAGFIIFVDIALTLWLSKHQSVEHRQSKWVQFLWCKRQIAMWF